MIAQCQGSAFNDGQPSLRAWRWPCRQQLQRQSSSMPYDAMLELVWASSLFGKQASCLEHATLAPQQSCVVKLWRLGKEVGQGAVSDAH